MRLQRKHLWFLTMALLFCLCALLVLFFLQSRESNQPVAIGEIAKTDALILSSDELSALLQYELSNYLPFETLEVAIAKDGTVTLNTSLKKAEVVRLFEEQQSSLRYAAAFLPDPIHARLSFRISCEEHSLYFEPTLLKVSEFDLTSWITPELTDTINSAIAHYFEEKEIKILSFRVLPDAISMNIKQSLA